MVGRGELTDAAWAAIEPLLPRNRRRGKQWADHRRVVNDNLWKPRTGAPWRDVPERYGVRPTCYDWFVRWRRERTGDRLLAHVQTKSDAVVWEVSIDSTTVRAHQHAAGGGRKRGASASPDEGLRRGWGGPTNPACDGLGWPLSVVVTAGQRHESTHLEPGLDAIRAARAGGRGCPRKRPHRLIADKGYSYERCRRLLRRRGIPHTIPEGDDQRARRARRPGRKPTFDKATYRWRNGVERCVNRLKQ